jgi:protein-disulfide isomerase
VIEFADFQCPFCAKASEQIHRLAEEHPGRLAIEYHHLPIAAHPFARRAALAAECAAAQGRFEPFYYLVFGNQTKLGKWSWNEFAKRAGVTNVTAFDTCLKSERFGQQVDADAEAADRLGVGGTPAWISNDSIFAGAPSLKQLERWIGKDSTRPPETVRTSSLDGGD